MPAVRNPASKRQRVRTLLRRLRALLPPSTTPTSTSTLPPPTSSTSTPPSSPTSRSLGSLPSSGLTLSLLSALVIDEEQDYVGQLANSSEIMTAAVKEHITAARRAESIIIEQLEDVVFLRALGWLLTVKYGCTLPAASAALEGYLVELVEVSAPIRALLGYDDEEEEEEGVLNG